MKSATFKVLPSDVVAVMFRSEMRTLSSQVEFHVFESTIDIRYTPNYPWIDLLFFSSCL